MKYHFQEKNKKCELCTSHTVFQFLQQPAIPSFPEAGMPVRAQDLARSH